MKSNIKAFLVKQINKYQKNLHDRNKSLFEEGYDKGKHAAYVEVLNLIEITRGSSD